MKFIVWTVDFQERQFHIMIIMQAKLLTFGCTKYLYGK